MTTTPETTTADLVAEYLQHKARMAEIEEELRSLPLGKHDAGEHTLTVIPNRRFDKAGFERDYPPTEAPELYEPETRYSLLTDEIDELTRDAYTKVAAPKISIK